MKRCDLTTQAPWKQRFRATNISSVVVAEANSKRGLVCSNAAEVLQLYAWDIATGNLKQVTFSPTGVWRGAIAAQGDYIYYLDDHQGNEIGHYVRVPFTGGLVEDITPDLPLYAATGICEDPSGSVIGFMTAQRDAFECYVINRDSDRDSDLVLSQPRLLWRASVRSSGLSFSQKGEIAVIATLASREKNAYQLIAIEVASGKLLGELRFPDANIRPVRFAPDPKDFRLLATSDRSGYVRPLIWDTIAHSMQEIVLPELEGDVQAWDWSRDGQLLLCQSYQAKQQLFRYHLQTESLQPITHPEGSIGYGSFTTNQTILLTFSNSTCPACAIELNTQIEGTARTVLAAGSVPPSRAWQSVTFPSTDGTAIQAWLAVPEGVGPFPTILHVHGGPTVALTDTFSPLAQTWLDHGFAWISVNYRGSTTFGKAFERAIWGQLGQLEVEDMVATRTWLIEHHIANPQALFVTGGSYGGYLTLQALGKYPDLWTGGMAEVAIADWFLMYEDQVETLRSVQRALFAGTPEEKPEAHRVASPITYAEQIKAPILVIQGRNDTRCPPRQMQAYEAKLRALGKSIQIHWFDAGHIAGATEQAIYHQELKLQFVYSILEKQGMH